MNRTILKELTLDFGAGREGSALLRAQPRKAFGLGWWVREVFL